MDISPQLLAGLEALLFVMGTPQHIDRFAKALDTDRTTMEAALLALETRYRETHSGLLLIRLEDTVQLTTKGQYHAAVERLRESEQREGLSRAALETLAVVAYRSPVTRADIDAIRGVNSQFTLRHLLIRGLIEREGNPEDARGYIYRPSFDFLKTLGIGKISELPDYDILSEDSRLADLLRGELPIEESAPSEPSVEKES
jgi:segregation and condensation protein B